MLRFLFLFNVISVLAFNPAIAQSVYEPEEVEIVVRTAESYLGTSYKWGGNGYAGIDCSGLTYKSFKAAGIEIPRNSRLQALHDMGTSVSERELRRGDLVFFNNGRSRNISHVGIITTAVSGNITFIHSSGKKGVDYDYLDDWASRFVAAKRVIKSKVEEIEEEPVAKMSLEDLRREIFGGGQGSAVKAVSRGGGSASQGLNLNDTPLSSDYLTLDDIRHLSSCEIKIKKNEIYARHGYEFHQNPKMMDYFQKQSWYKDVPKVSFSAEYIFFKYLSRAERHNVELLLKYEGDCP